jgi:hypothetical protein
LLGDGVIGGGGAIGTASGAGDQRAHAPVHGFDVKGVMLAAWAFDFYSNHNPSEYWFARVCCLREPLQPGRRVIASRKRVGGALGGAPRWKKSWRQGLGKAVGSWATNGNTAKL